MVCNQTMEGCLPEHLFLSTPLHPRGTLPTQPISGDSLVWRTLSWGEACCFTWGCSSPRAAARWACGCGDSHSSRDKKRVYGWMKPQPGPQRHHAGMSRDMAT